MIAIDPVGATFSLVYMTMLISFLYYFSDRDTKKPRKKKHTHHHSK